MLTLEAIIALLAAFAGALIALGIHQRRLERTATPQQMSGRTLENTLHNWEVQQEKRITNLETSLTTQLHQIQQAWEKWEIEDAARVETLAQDYKTAIMLLNLEHELARVLPTEETPLTISSNGQSRPTFANWRPAMLQGGNLRKRDLSYRYLGHANLREAQLIGATFLMTNLSGACLVGANLSDANLSGTDLSGADLSNAILTNANLLVADLHNAILTGANLLGARGLTTEQLRSAIYDNTTLVDSDIDDTPPRLQSMRKGGEIHTTRPQLEIVSPASSSLPFKGTPTSKEVGTPKTVISSGTPELYSQEEPVKSLPHMTPLIQYMAESSDDSRSKAAEVNHQESEENRRTHSATPKRKARGK